MSAALEPGMWVECVQNRLPTTQPPVALVVGRVYQIAAVGCTPPDDVNPNVPWVRLVEVPPREGRLGFRAAWFRPIRKPNIEVLKSLLQPAPQRDLEDA